MTGRPWREPPGAADRGPGHEGFTLVETITVLVILGVAAAAVVPALDALLRPGPRAAAEELAGAYRSARAAAASRAATATVTLDPRSGAWRVFVGSASGADDVLAGGNLLTDRADTRVVAPAGDRLVARFDARSRARAPTVVFERAGERFTVHVDPWTGAVRLR